MFDPAFTHIDVKLFNEDFIKLLCKPLKLGVPTGSCSQAS